MAHEQSPAYQWFVKDWRSSRATQRMSFSERGVYREMLDQQWEDMSLPDDAAAVADLIATSDGQVAEVLAAWPVVRRKFVGLEMEPGRIQNLRLERARSQLKRFVKGAKKGGRIRAALAARDARGAFQPVTSGHPAGHQPPHQRSTSTATAIATATSTALRADGSTQEKQTEEQLDLRAGDLVNRYCELYIKHRFGARYAQRPNLDWHAAKPLVREWDDARLEKLMVLVLTTDDEWISRTDRGFNIFALKASWADQALAVWEAQQKARV